MAEIRRLLPADAAPYRTLMLEASGRQPEAFTATVAEREVLPSEWWTAPIADDHMVGAFGNRQLVGTVGLRVERRPRTNHKATLFGLAVHRSAQGQGLGRRLVEAVITHALAMPGVEVLQIKVFASNAPACRLYESLGFVAYGTEPLAVRVGERFASVVHMWQPVGHQLDVPSGRGGDSSHDHTV